MNAVKRKLNQINICACIFGNAMLLPDVLSGKIYLCLFNAAFFWPLNKRKRKALPAASASSFMQNCGTNLKSYHSSLLEKCTRTYEFVCIFFYRRRRCHRRRFCCFSFGLSGQLLHEIQISLQMHKCVVYMYWPLQWFSFCLKTMARSGAHFNIVHYCVQKSVSNTRHTHTHTCGLDEVAMGETEPRRKLE